MKQFKLDHLYWCRTKAYTYAYIIRIVVISSSSYYMRYYNITTKEMKYTVVSKKDFDLALDSSKLLARELNKNEKAKVLLLGL